MPSLHGKHGRGAVEGQGFGLHELAVLAASLEHLVHDDSIGRLQSVFKAHDLPLTGGLSERLVDEAIDTYLCCTSREAI